MWQAGVPFAWLHAGGRVEVHEAHGDLFAAEAQALSAFFCRVPCIVVVNAQGGGRRTVLLCDLDAATPLKKKRPRGLKRSEAYISPEQARNLQVCIKFYHARV